MSAPTDAADRGRRLVRGRAARHRVRAAPPQGCESDHFAECIKARPQNRKKLMQTDPDEFVKVVTYWRERFL